MLAYVNGWVIPEEEAVVSVFDRGFLYGDGLFELVRVYQGRPFLWEAHAARWDAGCELLKIRSPRTGTELLEAVVDLIKINELQDAFVRLHLSRGRGERGYSPKSANQPTLIITAHPAPAPQFNTPPRLLKVITSRWSLRNEDPIGAAKHSNKLIQILARSEADDACADEALLLNERGEVLEGSSSNVFCIDGKNLITAPLEAGVLPGTTRGFVLQLVRDLGMIPLETRIRRAQLFQLDGLFLTSSALEIAEVIQVDGKPVKRSPSVEWLRKAYRRAVAEAEKQPER